MDGTGKLFAKLLPYLDESCTDIIPLPDHGSQTYEQLTAYVKSRLPEQDYILVAESFSGPIAVSLANESPTGLKGMVLVATFISPPNKMLLRLAEHLPIRTLLGLPLSSAVLRVFMLGSDARDVDIAAFKDIIRTIQPEVLKRRLQAIRSLSVAGKVSKIPAVSVRATVDRLVPADRTFEIRRCFDNLVEKTVAGPHFILQSRPSDCAAIINAMVDSCSASDDAHRRTRIVS